METKSMEQKFLESEIETYKHLYEIYKQQEETYRTNYFEIINYAKELHKSKKANLRPIIRILIPKH